MGFNDELERARRVYTSTDESAAIAALYSPFRPAALFTVQERDWVLAELLRRAGLMSLSGLDILDVGCGKGGELRRMTTFGADPDRLSGIDLMPGRVEAARKVLPAARIELGSAHELPFPDASFDLVSQFVVFSSIADKTLRANIAREMTRVLRPGGRIVWYDMHRVRPTPDLVPIKMAELRELFPDYAFHVRSTTLRWKLNQRVVWRSRGAALILGRVPFLCSHYMAGLEPAFRSARQRLR
jgi:ubiquinone/menaquinone biosynthesis C-methylase UbiE